ncbi:MAG: MotA/TolQ/ExbB proton channel family protein [Planctomycetota bacterium]
MSIWSYSLPDLFAKGGFMMWPLLGCSVLVASLVLDRLWVHALLAMDVSRFVRSLREFLGSGQRGKALELCRKKRHPAARLAVVYLEHENEGDAERGRLVEREGILLLASAQKYIGDLAVLSKIATLLGLLGTVTGLAATFRELEHIHGAAHIGTLASGIWEALITTVFGLIIAIPAVAACHYFQNQVNKMARWMGLVVSHLDSILQHNTPAESHAPHVDSVLVSEV